MGGGGNCENETYSMFRGGNAHRITDVLRIRSAGVLGSAIGIPVVLLGSVGVAGLTQRDAGTRPTARI
jgi:hypothetical protein